MRNICDIYAFISTNNDLLSTRNVILSTRNYFFQEVSSYLLEDKSEDTKGLIRRLKSKKDIQYNNETKGDNRTNNDLQTIIQKTKEIIAMKSRMHVAKTIGLLLKSIGLRLIKL